MTCCLSSFSSHLLNTDSFCPAITHICCPSPDVLLSIFIRRHLLLWQLLLLCVCARHMGHGSRLRLDASRSRAMRESENQPHMAILTCPLDTCNFTLSEAQALGVRIDQNADWVWGHICFGCFCVHRSALSPESQPLLLTKLRWGSHGCMTSL